MTPTADSTILGRIVRDTRKLIDERKLKRPISSLESQPYFNRAPISLAESLRKNGLSIIAEAKKASPSRGVIRSDYDPVAITSAYQESGAAAVSILTEPFHFRGDIEALPRCRPQLDIPILRKDFIVDPYQIVEAKAFGADAVLLIAACLDRVSLAELQQTAISLGMSVLVELYDPAEFEIVDVDITEIIGVNSRDLTTFEVDLAGALVALNELPDHVVRVAESGIRSLDDFKLVRDQGIQAALVGEAFMREEHPGRALQSIIEQLH